MKILCLMTHGRSGSKLFHSLLDSHPMVMCFPRSFHFNEFWRNIEPGKRYPEHIVDSFIHRYPRFFSGKDWYRYNKFDRADQLGPNRDETFTVDINEFRKNAVGALSETDMTRAASFIALHKAYHATCGRPLSERSLILYHIHAMAAEDELAACLTDFPGKTSLIIMTRHPIESMRSCVDIMRMRNTLSCGVAFHHQREILFCAKSIMERFSNIDIRILPIERLHLRHNDVMKSLVKWLGIDWDDALSRSTIHGKLWWGNGKAPRNGIDADRKAYQPKGFLEKKDWHVFLNLTNGRMKKFGYVDNASNATFSRTKVILLTLLPTAVECSILKLMLSPSYWAENLTMIKTDINDPRFMGIDPYTKKPLPEDGRAFNNKSYFDNFGLRCFKVCQTLISNIILLNPVKWLYYFIKRIIIFLQCDKEDSANMQITVL